MKRYVLIMIFCSVLAGCAASSALRFPPSRWVKDNDRMPILEPKERWKYSYAVGESERYQTAAFEKISTFIGVPKMVTGGNEEAFNVNNFDESPDSTWFTNRLGRFDISASDIAKGGGGGVPPGLKDDLEVVWVGRGEVAPEMIVEDDDGTHHLLLFDTQERPEAATGASIIANRLLYAFGYDLPVSRIVSIDRDRLPISPHAVTLTKYDEERPASSENLDKLWNMIATDPRTGLARAVMLTKPDGIAVGPFSFHGKRYGDKNDRISHENRRELRGLRTFCAFLDCGAMVDQQTGDLFIATDGDKGHLMHYILYTDNMLGAYGKEDAPQGYEPAKWNPFVSNAAFNMTTKRDAFWAAAILSRLSNDAIAAVVNEAAYSDKGARDAMIKKLIDRRDKTVAYWLGILSPLTNFELTTSDKTPSPLVGEGGGEGGFLFTFDDLTGKQMYRYRLRTERGRAVLKDWTEIPETKVCIDSDLAARILKKRLYVLEIQAKKNGDEYWLPPVDVFLKRTGPDEITLMGIARRYR